MLRRQQQFHWQVLQVLDALLLCLALYLAHALRFYFFPDLTFFEFGIVGPFDNYLWLLGIILPAGPLLLDAQGVYRLSALDRWSTTLFRVGKSIVFIWLILFAVIILLRIPQIDMSRAVLVLFVPIGIAMIMGREIIYRAWLRTRARVQGTRQHVLICGSTRDQESWQDKAKQLPTADFHICGGIDLRANTLNEFIRCLHRDNIDVVIFEFDHALVPEQNLAIRACELEGIEAWITTDFIQTKLARPQFDQFLDRMLLVYRFTPDASWSLLTKSLFDRLGAACLLLIFSPLFLIITLAIRISSGSPVLFRQSRSGRYGRPFTMYKFRTMVTHAEQTHHELKAFNAMTGPAFKMNADPRVTKLGRLLRKYSLDELPQLWNVLHGEMSLVGPRPLPLYETESFVDFSQRRRMSVKPGITCLWQIAGRNEIKDFSDWVKLDLDYIDQWSLWLDFKILLFTIPAVLRARGAK